MTRRRSAGRPPAGLLPGELRRRGCRQPGPRCRCWTLLEREGWFEAGDRARHRCLPVAPAPARPWRRLPAWTAGHRPDPHRLRHRHLRLSRSAAVRASPSSPMCSAAGMSSRLFQRVREELGLAYAIYAYQKLYQSTGLAGVYVGTQPATAEQRPSAIRRGVRPAGRARALAGGAGRAASAAQGTGHAGAGEPAAAG